jgi:transposase InsO family protein
LKDFLTANRIEHFRSAVGHPQSNGLAERTIRTVTERLGSLVAEGKTSLRRALPKVAFSINTTTSESLQATPFELLHGFKAVLPGEPSRLPVQPQVPVTELRAEAHRQLEKAQERMKAKFDLKSSSAHSFEEGDS